ncbi:hypothetical protein F5X99DRAFT_397436 [Biscogniauxia marginata]|nr:hypothetical protein F5X99DRAFT_397436 [Biscogniauxia marginata]
MDKANLTRIRDNQRRSRARRKEYVQELEKRLSDFKREGVEVTSQIRKAARGVAEENRLLRVLLRQQGCSDEKTNEFIQTNTMGTPVVQSSPQALGSTAQVLEFGLEHRLPQPFEAMAHPVNFTSELSKPVNKEGTDGSILSSQRRLSTSHNRASSRTYCWNSESRPNHNAFIFNTPRYHTSFSSESSDACTIESTEHPSQIYTSTAGGHLISDGAQHISDATGTDHGPLLLEPVDHETELGCAGSMAYNNLEAFQLHHQEDLSSGNLASLQSAAAKIGGTITANDVSSFLSLEQKGSDYNSYVTNPSY